MSDCSHDCDSCANKCEKAESLVAEPHHLSKIKKVIAVISGKGGVGKSLTTALLAVLMTAQGKKCAILDADITGPSVPKMFGIKGGITGIEGDLEPRSSRDGIKIISSNLLLQNENDPVIWRGPLIAGMVRQFWTDVVWGEVDYMFVDCPPGTGDVPLTVFQSIKVDGIIVVTSPQELVSMIVEKAVKMAQMMNIPVLGVVENMSYVRCPDCAKEIALFGEGKVNEVAKDFNLKVLGRLPIDPEIAKACDGGKIEDIKIDYLNPALTDLLEL
ncbi:MAG: P-loop NTPase [Bdellovibrionota bacterium]|jgi:Mrp family chromosome partitioning ATPase